MLHGIGCSKGNVQIGLLKQIGDASYYWAKGSEAKLKLLKTNAAMRFNKMCKIKQLKPNYINIKLNGQKPQDKRTTINAIRFRINQEIKFLFHKKQHLNQRRYCLHLEGAHKYNGMWRHIQEYIDAEISRLMDSLYQKLNKKLDALTNQAPSMVIIRMPLNSNQD